MEQAFRNLTTKHYCPKCGSFHLQRVHRGFVKKSLLRLPAQYKCQGCSAVLSESRLDKNEVKTMPQFIT